MLFKKITNNRFISAVLACLFLLNDFSWALPASNQAVQKSTLAPELRLKPFYDRHKMDFNSAYSLYSAALNLKKIIDKGEVRDVDVERLRRKLGARTIELVKDEGKDEFIASEELSTGRRCQYAVFHIKKENVKIKTIFPDSPENLNDTEKIELGIKTEKDIDYFEMPGLRGVWFKRIYKEQPATAPVEAEKLPIPTNAFPFSEIMFNGEIMCFEAARGKILAIKAKMRLLFNMRIVKNRLEIGCDEQGSPHLNIKYPRFLDEGVFLGSVGSKGFDLRPNFMMDDVENFPQESIYAAHNGIIMICRSLIAFGISPSLELSPYTRDVIAPFFLFTASGLVTLNDLANQELLRTKGAVSEGTHPAAAPSGSGNQITPTALERPITETSPEKPLQEWFEEWMRVNNIDSRLEIRHVGNGFEEYRIYGNEKWTINRVPFDLQKESGHLKWIAAAYLEPRFQNKRLAPLIYLYILYKYCKTDTIMYDNVDDDVDLNVLQGLKKLGLVNYDKIGSFAHPTVLRVNHDLIRRLGEDKGLRLRFMKKDYPSTAGGLEDDQPAENEDKKGVDSTGVENPEFEEIKAAIIKGVEEADHYLSISGYFAKRLPDLLKQKPASLQVAALEYLLGPELAIIIYGKCAELDVNTTMALLSIYSNGISQGSYDIISKNLQPQDKDLKRVILNIPRAFMRKYENLKGAQIPFVSFVTMLRIHTQNDLKKLADELEQDPDFQDLVFANFQSMRDNYSAYASTNELTMLLAYLFKICPDILSHDKYEKWARAIVEKMKEFDCVIYYFNKMFWDGHLICMIERYPEIFNDRKLIDRIANLCHAAGDDGNLGGIIALEALAEKMEGQNVTVLTDDILVKFRKREKGLEVLKYWVGLMAAHKGFGYAMQYDMQNYKAFVDNFAKRINKLEGIATEGMMEISERIPPQGATPETGRRKIMRVDARRADMQADIERLKREIFKAIRALENEEDVYEYVQKIIWPEYYTIDRPQLMRGLQVLEFIIDPDLIALIINKCGDNSHVFNKIAHLYIRATGIDIEEIRCGLQAAAATEELDNAAPAAEAAFDDGVGMNAPQGTQEYTSPYATDRFSQSAIAQVDAIGQKISQFLLRNGFAEGKLGETVYQKNLRIVSIDPEMPSIPMGDEIFFFDPGKGDFSFNLEVLEPEGDEEEVKKAGFPYHNIQVGLTFVANNNVVICFRHVYARAENDAELIDLRHEHYYGRSFPIFGADEKGNLLELRCASEFLQDDNIKRIIPYIENYFGVKFISEDTAEIRADKIHAENLKYMPDDIPKNKVFCRVIAESILPEEQKNLLVQLDIETRDEAYWEKVVRLENKDPKKFINDVRNLIDEQKRLYEGRDVEFDIGCPSKDLVRQVINTDFGEGLKVNAIAFKPCKSPAQVEGIILALRALHNGDLEGLKEIFEMLSGRKLSAEDRSIADIDEFARKVVFELPVIEGIDFGKELKDLNDLIKKNILNAA